MLNASQKSHQGKITVFSGPMFAGKTTQLLEIAEQLTRFNRPFLAYKPRIDNRYSATEIASHKKNALNCIVIDAVADIPFHPPCPNILIDEAQFFEKDAAQYVRTLAGYGSNFYIAGLNMDSFGHPFGPMPELMAIANTVVHLVTICEVCGDYDAKYTYRKSHSTEQTSVGGSESYGPRCSSCWFG